MKKILITGVAGFIGAALTKKLFESKEDYLIVGVSTDELVQKDKNKTPKRIITTNGINLIISCLKDFAITTKNDGIPAK